MTRSTEVDPPIGGAVATSADLLAIVPNAGCRPSIQEAWIAITARGHDVAAYTPAGELRGVAGPRRQV